MMANNSKHNEAAISKLSSSAGTDQPKACAVPEMIASNKRLPTLRSSQTEGVILISVAQVLDQEVVVKLAQPASLQFPVLQINAHDGVARSERYV